MPLGNKGKEKLGSLFKKTDISIASPSLSEHDGVEHDNSQRPAELKKGMSGKRRGFYLPNELSKRLDRYVAAHNLLNEKRIRPNDVVKMALTIYLDNQEESNPQINMLIDRLIQKQDSDVS